MIDRPSAGAAWLPSRFCLATFRLIGLIVAVAKRRRRVETMTLLHMAKDQHPFEFYAVAVAFLLVPTLHAWALIIGVSGLTVIAALPFLIVLPFAVTLAWDLLVFGMGAFLWATGKLAPLPVSRNRIQSLVAHSAMIAIAAAAIIRHWPTAWLGIAWLALVAFNGIAWLIMAPLKGYVDRLTAELLGSE